MSKREVNKLKIVKNDKNTDSKKRYKFNILIVLLSVIFIVWLGLLLFKYNQYNRINDKINKILEYENKIKYINDNYDLIRDNVNKINDIKSKNELVNKDIDVITKNIEELHFKISKYVK